MSIQRCAHCIGGTVLAGSCIACGREVNPNLVTFGEALLGSSMPLKAPGDSHGYGPRQEIPLAVSLERTRLWSKGERA